MIPGESFQFLVMPKPTLAKSGFRLRAVALASSCGVLLVGCGGGSVTAPMDDQQTAEEQAARQAMQMRATEQKAALDKANKDLTAALPPPLLNSQDKIDAANDALKKLNDAITAAVDVSDADKAEYVNDANTAMLRIGDAQRRFNADEDARVAMERERQRMEEAAEAERMAALAKKLYAVLTPSNLNSASHATGSNAGDLQVKLDLDGNDGNAGICDGNLNCDGSETIYLSEDKDAEVADNHGWEGKRYTFSGTTTVGGTAFPGTYEAMVWSNVEAPKEGEKFSTEYSANFTGGTLNEATTEGNAGRVASPRFDHTAGLKRFGLPDPNPRGQTIVTVPGSYHGVAGTYHCDPADGSTCAASFAGPGFNLGGVTADGTFAADNAEWTFRPADANARVMGAEDTVYSSYGWWLRTAEDGTLTAHAFSANKGRVRSANTFGLHGTATYRGGAAGQYALASPTGGTNDAGAFTARATLEADFTASTISGTIDAFRGADGEGRDWEVELKKTGFSFGSWDSGNDSNTTVWTIGDTAAGASGGWNGAFYEGGDDGVPKVVTGAFHTRYGRDGRMIGALGTNMEE